MKPLLQLRPTHEHHLHCTGGVKLGNFTQTGHGLATLHWGWLWS